MNTTILIIAIVVAVLAFMVIRARMVMKNTPVVDDHESIIKLTDKKGKK